MKRRPLWRWERRAEREAQARAWLAARALARAGGWAYLSGTYLSGTHYDVDFVVTRA